MKQLIENAIINGKLQNLLIENAGIAYIGTDKPDYDKSINLDSMLLIPSMIDQHTHIRDMQQDYKEDWETASKAAVSGGVATVFDMPNTIPPTTNLNNLNKKRKASVKAFINKYFFVGGTESNVEELEEVLKLKPEDVPGIKVFMAGSSSNEVVAAEESLKRLCNLSLKYDKPLVVHSENQECIEKWQQKINENHAKYHHIMRHRDCAIESTRQILRIADAIGNKLYLAHISLAEELEMIREYRKNNPYIFCETTPHHLLLNVEEHIEAAGNFGKVNPPVRTKTDNIAVNEAIADGTVDTIGSDHAPHSIEEKQREYAQAPSGFPGLETTIALLINEINENRLSVERLIQLTSAKQAEIFKIARRGKLQPGYIADLTAIDMNKKWTVKARNFFSKAKYSPYEDWQLQGKVVMTFVNGIVRYDANHVVLSTDFE